jgi:hypothetical protein
MRDLFIPICRGPVEIRVGFKEKLHADPRGLAVTSYSGTKPPCPCVADGIMIAAQASPGQHVVNIARKCPRRFYGGKL